MSKGKRSKLACQATELGNLANISTANDVTEHLRVLMEVSPEKLACRQAWKPIERPRFA
jgi:hypothetical protein